jgi:hypothetical protein
MVVATVLLAWACDEGARDRDPDESAPAGGQAPAGGSAPSPDAAPVTDAAPPVDGGPRALSLNSLRPDIQVNGGPVEIFGAGIHDPSRAAGEPAGAEVQLVKGPDVLAALNVTVQAGSRDFQVLRFEVPTRDGTPWGPREVVDVVVTFEGQSAALAFEYDDP